MTGVRGCLITFRLTAWLQEGRGSPYRAQIVDRDVEYVEAAEGRKFPQGK